MATIATLCSGGECVGIGAQMAGLKHLYGIEYKEDIAQVAINNGFNVLVRDITQCNPLDYERPNVLHASPPCPNFSVAKSGGIETTEDISIARAVCNFISVLHPDIFTLENVYGYRKSQSWTLIAKTLQNNGYGVAYWHLNAANYGVPQTRKRMVVIARSDGITPQKPAETHAQRDKIKPMFDDRLPWIGWYQAIEDLIPTLPDSEFAPWQLERLSGELRTILVPGGNNSFPTPTAQDPSFTIGSGNIPCTFILDGTTNDNGESITIKDESNPIMTIEASAYKRPLRAFIVPGGNSSSFSLRTEDEPVRTIGDTERTGNLSRAYVGRIVKMTPRCLARFQSIPDTYILPDSNALACRVIGNGVPPLLYKTVIESVLSSTNPLVKVI